MLLPSRFPAFVGTVPGAHPLDCLVINCSWKTSPRNFLRHLDRAMITMGESFAIAPASWQLSGIRLAFYNKEFVNPVPVLLAAKSWRPMVLNDHSSMTRRICLSWTNEQSIGTGALFHLPRRSMNCISRSGPGFGQTQERIWAQQAEHFHSNPRIFENCPSRCHWWSINCFEPPRRLQRKRQDFRLSEGVIEADGSNVVLR